MNLRENYNLEHNANPSMDVDAFGTLLWALWRRDFQFDSLGLKPQEIFALSSLEIPKVLRELIEGCWKDGKDKLTSAQLVDQIETILTNLKTQN